MLSKTPVLDKGFVAIMNTSVNDTDIRTLWNKWTLGFDKQLMHMPTVHMRIKCPLFVQLRFAQFNLHTLVQRKSRNVEAYLPNEVDVNAKDLEASRAISEDIQRTTEALLLNPKAYQYEACDTFISQVISPINVYNELIVTGNLQQWVDFIQQSNIPKPIEAYRAAIEDLLVTEFVTLEKWIKRDDSKKT